MPTAKRIQISTWADQWAKHVAKWKNCQLCPLGKQRDRIVLARGTLPCDVLFIGEAPGASEDALGQPFVGPAGDRLNKIIERALPPTISYALTNLNCCFPREAKMFSDNHQPTPNEIRACRPRLFEFINMAQPALIVCVGALPAAWIDHDNGVRCVDIIHPAATFPGRMPLAQATMALQKCVVVLRNAIEDMVQLGRQNFTNWRTEYADINSQSGYLSDDSIPF